MPIKKKTWIGQRNEKEGRQEGNRERTASVIHYTGG